MSEHRWIRRKDGTVDLYIAGMIVGRVTTQHGARTVYWQGGYSGGPATSKAEAKRLVLRAVVAPRVRRKAETRAGEWRPNFTTLWVDGQPVGTVSEDIGESWMACVLGKSGEKSQHRTFTDEAEARAWVEWRAGRKA